MKRAILALAALGLMGAAPAPAFRIGVLQSGNGPCTALPSSAPAGEHAYFELLTKRLDRDVLACPVASLADGAAALAAGKLDMTVLDPASYAPVKSSVRAAMTVQLDGTPARGVVILAVKAGHDGAPQALNGRIVAFGGASTVALALPRQVLTEQGYGEGLAQHEHVAANETDALAAVRAGKADALALGAAAWQRQCQNPSPKVQGCADLMVVWRARPQAQRAFAVRRDMPDPLRFRVLGVHVAMNIEDRPAFDWVASQLAAGAAEFEPAEAQALERARLQ